MRSLLSRLVSSSRARAARRFRIREYCFGLTDSVSSSRAVPARTTLALGGSTGPARAWPFAFAFDPRALPDAGLDEEATTTRLVDA